MIAGLLALDGARLNGHPTERLPGNVNVSFRGADSESLLLALDLQGVAASSGSACTSGTLEPSHVLAAIGLDAETAAGTLRFSLGRWTTAEEVDYVLGILPGILQQVRSALVR
jgi:cysteine desulfurase